ncbi:hypothetical protein ACIP2X_19080 [Streptomyces sp. NPDC089424]|uniref:hypothetical protein n=1 Tax=Streptomyces sp. NPDC089424 TaxID=3365917 RepID=UPI00381637B0
MAEPDNVARLIAAGSALFTALNMSVSYAAWRQKRPAVVMRRARINRRYVDHSSGPVLQLSFTALVRNRSEVPVTVTEAYLYLTERRRERVEGQRTHDSLSDIWQLHRLNESGPLVLEAFGTRSVAWTLDTCLRPFQELPFHKGMIRLELFNGRLAWSRRFKVSFEGPCHCSNCIGMGEQLSFDELS